MNQENVGTETHVHRSPLPLMRREIRRRWARVLHTGRGSSPRHSFSGTAMSMPLYTKRAWRRRSCSRNFCPSSSVRSPCRTVCVGVIWTSASFDRFVGLSHSTGRRLYPLRLQMLQVGTRHANIGRFLHRTSLFLCPQNMRRRVKRHKGGRCTDSEMNLVQLSTFFVFPLVKVIALC